MKENKFSEDAKIALVRPLYKKNDRDEIQNLKPVSILNGFSKVYEILSNFKATYRKTFSSSRGLKRLIGNWKKHLDNKKIAGTVLIDISKLIYCIPHDLVTAKLHVYGFNKSP